MKTKFENNQPESQTSQFFKFPNLKQHYLSTTQPTTLWTQFAFDFLTQKNFTMKTKSFFSILLTFAIALSFNFSQAQVATSQSKYFNFPEEDFDIQAMVKAPDGGTVFTGTRTRYDYYNREIVDWTGVYVIRTDANGRAKWLKYYTMNYSEVCHFEATTIENGIDGGFMVGGIFSNCLNVNEGMFLMSIDDDGYMVNMKYHKKFDTYSSVLLKEIKRDGNEGYVGIATVVQEDMEAPLGTLVFKCDIGGELQARNLFTYDSGDLEAKAIEVYPEDGYVLLAENQFSDEGIYSTNPVIIKIDDQLDEVWNRYVNSGLEQVSAVDIAIGISDDILLTGNVNPYDDDENLIYLMSLKPDGNTKWENAFHWRACDVFINGSNEVKGLAVDEEGNIYIGGNAWPFFFDDGSGNITTSIDPFVIRTNSHGLGQWLHFYGREFDEIMTTMAAVDGIGFTFGGYILEDQPSQSTNNFSAWVTKGDGNGISDCDYRSHPLQSINHKFWPNVVWLDKSQEDLETLEVYAEEGVQTIIAYICYVFNVTSYDEMPLIGIPNDGNDLQQTILQKQTSSSVFPNPSDGKFNVRVADFFENETAPNITILDTTGKVILSQSIENMDTEFEMTHLPKGTYFVKIQSREKLEQHKLIIQ